MTERVADEDEGTFEERLLDYAERQATAAERTYLLFSVLAFVGLVGVVVWLIAVLGS